MLIAWGNISKILSRGTAWLECVLLMVAMVAGSVRKLEAGVGTGVTAVILGGRGTADGTRETAGAVGVSHPYSFGLFV